MPDASKPRPFQSQNSFRGTCERSLDGRVVDVRVDLYDDRTSAADMRRFAKWLIRAADWLEGGEK